MLFISASADILTKKKIQIYVILMGTTEHTWVPAVLKLQNFVWGNAYASLTKRIRNANEIYWKLCFKFKFCPRIRWKTKKKTKKKVFTEN